MSSAPGQRGASLVLVAHGTRDPGGTAVSRLVAARVQELVPLVPVRLAFADVRGPTLGDVLIDAGPSVVVPMFLAAGYHVRVDVPAQVAATGRADVRLAETFGPDPVLVEVAAGRLAEAGLRAGDAVVLAVAGSSDPVAVVDAATAGRLLGRRLGVPVSVATVAAGGPRVPEAVAGLRARGARRVAVASWLLAPGLFQRTLADAGADVVGAPLGDHPAVAELVVSRYCAAVRGLARTA